MYQSIKEKLIDSNFISFEEGYIFTPLSSLTNAIYKVQKEHPKNEHEKQLQYILKIFKPESIPEFTDHERENKVAQIFSKVEGYPMIYEVNSKYRLEQFVRGNAPSYSDFTEQQFMKVGKMLADFSNMGKQLKNIADEKYKIENLFKTFRNIAKEAQKIHEKQYLVCQKVIKEILNSQIQERLAKIVPKNIVFSHNDSHFGNMIRTQKNGLILLDFQFSCDNYRGFDLGNFFNDCTCDYQGKFCVRQERQLPLQIKKKMIETYYFNIHCDISLEEAVHEVEIGRMLGHLFWFFIGLKQINDLEELDMIGYVHIRHEEFFKFYKRLL